MINMVMRGWINRVVLVAEASVAVGLRMPSAISSAIFLVKVVDVSRGLRCIRVPIYVTTWRSLSSKLLRVTPRKFGYQAGVTASHVTELAQSLVARLRDALLVMVMAKFVSSRASSQCNKLALSAAALASTFPSHARLAMAAVNIKNKKHSKSKSLRVLMMVCACAPLVTASQA